MINITDKAKAKIIELKTQDGLSEDFFLRASVEGGGCSGLNYKLDFDNKVEEGKDHVFGDDTAKVVVEMKSLLYLVDSTLDFSDGLNGKGFEFSNPNATRTCGCGESFSV